ncbi:MAG: group III truncated hemoglobin [Hyphomonas sp.]|nr:group III truncated hemoglobin [Hyphomonas sp.]
MTDPHIVRRSGAARQASIEETAAALGIDEAFVSALVDGFYGRVRQDDLIGPIFDAAIGDAWDTHLPKMKDFWSSMALGTRRYAGRPMPAHLKLPGLGAAHFTRWLALFRETLDEIAPNPAAHAFFLDRAARIAHGFQVTIAQMRPEVL